MQKERKGPKIKNNNSNEMESGTHRPWWLTVTLVWIRSPIYKYMIKQQVKPCNFTVVQIELYVSSVHLRESNLKKSQWLVPTIGHFQCFVDHEIISSQIAGIQDNENCPKLSSIRKDKDNFCTKWLLQGLNIFCSARQRRV